jgi:5-methylcytosine-specific restriction protein A
LHDLGFRIVGKNSEHDVFEVPTFVPGEVHRCRDLHEQYGGQGQGGISTPKEHPMIFLITGESGSQYGYTDGFRSDGTYWYTGEGQVGDGDGPGKRSDFEPQR